MTAKTQDLSDARWDDVRLFLALQRHGSLGAAGGRLGLDTSTVSRRLTALEEALGARLFERTRAGIVPTRLAEMVLPAAEAMEAAHGRFTRDASNHESGAEGVVRLSAAPGMADAFVAPLLSRLRARHPRIRIELDASVRPLDLTRHEADLALRSLRPQGADLVMTRLGADSWLAAASPELTRSLGRLAAWEDAPWITWDRDLASMPAARWVARYAARAEIVLRTSHFASQLTAAAEGLGVLLVPQPYMRLRGLAPVRYTEALASSAEALPSDELWLVGHRALREVPRVAAVWEFLLEDLGRLFGGRRAKDTGA